MSQPELHARLAALEEALRIQLDILSDLTAMLHNSESVDLNHEHLSKLYTDVIDIYRILENKPQLPEPA